MKVYLDDERTAPDGWVLVKTVDDVIYLLDCITDLSLDHDLGEGNKTGYDLMVYLEDKVYNDETFNIPNITFHTQNPVGLANMRICLRYIYKILDNRNL
jgi:hypothetical protein